MEKEFVTYAESVALKELGFDEPCIKEFHDQKLLSNSTGEEITNNELIELYGEQTVISAPLCQQAFRWFREKYNIIPNIHSIYTDETHTKIMFWFWFGNYEDDSDEEVFYGTYEETELECLKKLIEIVKNK